MQYKDLVLERIAHGDDGDTKEFTVSVAYEVHPAEPDVGIMQEQYEIHDVYNGATRYNASAEEFEYLEEQLANG